MVVHHGERSMVRGKTTWLVVGVAMLVIAMVVLKPQSHRQELENIPETWWKRNLGAGNCGAGTRTDCSGVVLRRDQSRALPPSDSMQRYRKEGWTRSVRELFSDGVFFRLEKHSVVQAASPNHVINDWMWCEVPDMVNVLAQGTDGKFLVFKQTKYGLDGESLALLGGYVKAGESADAAASREVLEETGMECKNMKFLGNFRTDANRGFGYLYAFLGQECQKSSKTAESDDLEVQTPTYLDVKELRNEVVKGSFKEVKWTATIGLALLSMDK